MDTITKNPYDDPSDKYDIRKWDFDESDLNSVFIDGYLYKYVKVSNCYKLRYIRNEITRLINEVSNWPIEYFKKVYLDYNVRKICSFEEFMVGLQEMFDIYLENEQPSIFYEYCGQFTPKAMTSRYLLSELPNNKQAKVYDGINKPRMRYISNKKSMGIDGNKRALYRDIFLNLDLNKKELKSLLLHELSHIFHIKYREKENHQEEFKALEFILKEASKKIGFLDDL